MNNLYKNNLMSCEDLFVIKDLGVIEYNRAFYIQNEYLEKIREGEKQVILLCEHPTVITSGRLADRKNIKASVDDLVNNKINAINTNRGGDITLHSPGQLVIYPIFNLNNYKKDLRWYLNKLEQVAIDLLKQFDIVANRFSGQIGVWVGDKKLVSIGVGIRKWITFHGLAINVNTDLSLFSLIKPCGLNVEMTSIGKILGKYVEMDKVKKNVIGCFAKNFNI